MATGGFLKIVMIFSILRQITLFKTSLFLHATDLARFGVRVFIVFEQFHADHNKYDGIDGKSCQIRVKAVPDDQVSKLGDDTCSLLEEIMWWMNKGDLISDACKNSNDRS